MTLFNFLFCSVLLYSASYCLPILPIENPVFPETGAIGRDASPSLLNFCTNARQAVMSRKIICIICKGFDPSCFHKSTTSTVAPTTSANVSTTSAATTTSHTPTSTTTLPTSTSTSHTPTSTTTLSTSTKTSTKGSTGVSDAGEE